MQLPRATIGVGGLLLLTAGSAAAQDTAPQAVPDSVRALVSEFQELQARLQQTQAQAIREDSTLQSEQQDLQETVQETMVEMNPAMGAKIDSLSQLQEEAVAAQQAGDTTRVQTIVETGQRIQGQVQQAQEQALQEEEVVQELEAFQEKLMVAMVEIDPEIRSVVERLEELSARLRAISQG